MPCSPIIRIDFPEEGCDAAEKQADCARPGRAGDGDARGGRAFRLWRPDRHEHGTRDRCRLTADPRAEAAENVRLVGYNDLQGRTALVVTTKSDAANGSWVYVGHHESFRDGKPLMNPITGKMEFNGTSILDIADPSNPKLVWHIPNETNRNSRGVSVVYDYKFDGSGRDYLIRNSEALTQGETGSDLKYQIFDITTRDSDPSKISLVVGDHRHAAELVRSGLRRQVHHARAQRLVVRGNRILLRRVGRTGVPQRDHPDLRSEESEGAEARRPRVDSRAEGRRAGLRRAVLASSGRGRGEQAALRRLPQRRRPGGVVRHLQPGAAEAASGTST